MNKGIGQNILISQKDQAIFCEKIDKQRSLLGEKIKKAKSLAFYKTSYSNYNTIKHLTDSLAKKIIDEHIFLVIGDGVKKTPPLLEEFVDYTYEKYIGKKIVLFYGNCHTGAVKKYMITSKEFCARYIIYPIKEIQEVNNPAYFEMPVFKICDVFIHQSIWKKNRYGKEFASDNVIKKISKKSQIIAMPNVYHLPCCLFPQYYEASELRYNNQTYFFRDKIIDEELRKGKTPVEIAEKYFHVQFDYQSIQSSYERFLETVKRREEEWDIKVSSFIERNIKECRMFYEMNHPTSHLIKYYASEILGILLDCKNSFDEKCEYQMDSYQMPLLSEVQKALGLMYSDENREIRITGVKIRNKKMDIYEYVKQYFSTIWMSGEFEKRLILKSKMLFALYKSEGFFLKIIKKRASLFNNKGRRKK